MDRPTFVIPFDTALVKGQVTPVGGTTPAGYKVKLIGGKRQYIKPGEKKQAKQEQPKEVVTKRDWIDHAPGMPKQTRDKYAKVEKVTGKDGKTHEKVTYTKGRQSLHADIVNKFLAGKKPADEGQQKVAVVMMGGPASGKTSLVRGILGERFDDFVNVNPDDVKEDIPEYNDAVSQDARDAAYMAHEESSDIAGVVKQEAEEGGYNIIVDGTGKDASKHIGTIKDLQSKGYRIMLLMPDVGMQEAVNRVEDRATKTGRYVPEDIVRMAHAKIPGNFEKIARESDEFALYNSRGRPPEVMWEGGKDKEDTVHDEGFVDKFKTRGAKAQAYQSRKEARQKDVKERKGELTRSMRYTLPGYLRKGALKPAFTVADLNACLKQCPESKMYPEDKLPKKYDAKDGVRYGTWGDPDYVNKKIGYE
jgi:predicted ABC-type ATPase